MLQNVMSLEAALLEEEERYIKSNPTSSRMYTEARKSLPGGNTRLVLYFDPFPLFFLRTYGSRVVDVDEHDYADFGNDLTAALYGHSNIHITGAIKEALEYGLNFGGTHKHEVAFGAEICRRFPSIERVRFCTSGSEANLAAVQMARAITGRRLILGFKGGYHGNSINWTTKKGIADLNVDRSEAVLARFNDSQSVHDLVRKHGDDIAGIIVEPIMGSAGGFKGDRDFLSELRSVSEKIGAILVFDEVQTARFAIGGYQSIVNIYPDITTLGKFFGGGLNFGAIGGRADLMDRLGPGHPDMLLHGGTFNNNILTMIAGYTALTKVMTPSALEKLDARSLKLRRGLRTVAQGKRAPVSLGSHGSLIAIHFQETAPRNIEEVQTLPQIRKLFQLFMLNNYLFATRRGQLTLSLENTDEECNYAIDLFDEFLGKYGHLIGT